MTEVTNVQSYELPTNNYFQFQKYDPVKVQKVAYK